MELWYYGDDNPNQNAHRTILMNSISYIEINLFVDEKLKLYTSNRVEYSMHEPQQGPIVVPQDKWVHLAVTYEKKPGKLVTFHFIQIWYRSAPESRVLKDPQIILDPISIHC